MGDDLHGAHERRCFPVALAGEAVAVGHQALDSEAGELSEPAEIFEVAGESAEPAVGQERAQPGRQVGHGIEGPGALAVHPIQELPGAERRLARVGKLPGEFLAGKRGDRLDDRH